MESKIESYKQLLDGIEFPQKCLKVRSVAQMLLGEMSEEDAVIYARKRIIASRCDSLTSFWKDVEDEIVNYKF